MKSFGSQLLAEFIHCSKKILNDKKALERVLVNGIKASNIELKGLTAHQFEPIGVTIVCIVSESHIAIHTFPEAGQISIDIFTCAADYKKPQVLLNFLKKYFRPKTLRMMKVIRGNPLEIEEKNWITSFSGYGFETRYHIKKSIVSRNLKYQKIDIIENENFGRMLFLDHELQISERDAAIYHAHIIQPLIELKHKINHMAILGGGDGGVLCEVLKYYPQQVYLVEIEREMIDLCRKHLSCICRKAFDQPNVKVVIDDANTFLTRHKSLDVIIYDLTMHPASLTQLDRKTFLNQIFKNIQKALTQGGLLSLQCCPEFDEETLKILKKILRRYFTDVTFKHVFIPSFCENLVFATARKSA